MAGPDALNPADTPHWRQIRTSTGTGWVNLNAMGVTKFSDADAPQWVRWQLRSAPGSASNSRCRDLSVIWVLDTDHDNRFTEPEMRAALNKPDIRALYRHLVCKVQTEWERAGVVERWKWLTQPPSGAMPALRPDHMTDEEYTKFCDYAQALCFWEDANLGIDALHWHFHPREFIAHFRKCGWLSKDELARVYPDSKYPQQALAQEGRGRTPESIREEYRVSINKLLRKYFFTTPIRQAHFLGQGAVESFYLAAMLETSVSVTAAIRNNRISLRPETNGYLTITATNTTQTQYFNRYENMTGIGNDLPGDGIKFRGRGLKQLTGKYNYTEYWVYRGRVDRSSF